ncbi:MAG TPA: hypothetical protein VF824_15500 [Thermoanaerobaculia bacterium]|jgi:hypothetical protein
MKTLLLVSLLALPLHAEVRGAVRAGAYAKDLAGSIELEARRGDWSVVPAFEVIGGGYGLHATHVDLRRWLGHAFVGAGATFLATNAPSSATTWNADLGYAWGRGDWRPFVAVRYFTFDLRQFRDTIEGDSATISIGISRRLR